MKTPGHLVFYSYIGQTWSKQKEQPDIRVREGDIDFQLLIEILKQNLLACLIAKSTASRPE